MTLHDAELWPFRLPQPWAGGRTALVLGTADEDSRNRYREVSVVADDDTHPLAPVCAAVQALTFELAGVLRGDRFAVDVEDLAGLARELLDALDQLTPGGGR